jgi:hypothetical protein
MKRLTAAGVLAMVPCAAAAQSTGVLATRRPITWGMIFALLFLMLAERAGDSGRGSRE